ncbi:MAG: NAD(P)H-binding protein [Gemmatimonadota bacterium]
MRLLVLGASGGCGQWVVRLARERGHVVTAVVRPATSFPEPDGVEVVRGQVLEDGLIERAIGGQEAVLSCLGPKRENPRNAWSKYLSPPDFAERTARMTVSAMRRQGVSRIVAISAAGVAESVTRLNWLIRFMIARSNLRAGYEDLAGMEREYARGGLDWLVVRPVTLADGPPTGAAHEIDRYGLTSRISRADVATWMLDAVEQSGPFTEHSVMIGWM